MRLFSGWFGSSKAKESTEAIHPDIEAGINESDEKVEMINEDEERNKEKKILKEFLAKIHILAVTSLSDKGVFKVQEKDPQSSWFRMRNTILDKSLNFNEVLEHLKTVENVEVRFNGTLEQIRSILEKIPLEWFAKQHSVQIDISDGLWDCSPKELNEWMQLVLKIQVLMRDLYHTKWRNKHWKYIDVSQVSQYDEVIQLIGLDDVYWKEFSVTWPAMLILSYEYYRQILLTGRFPFYVSTKRVWNAMLKVIRAEADSYEESEQVVVYIMSGQFDEDCMKVKTVYFYPGN